MRRAARIVYLVGGITSLVSALSVLIVGVVYTCIGAIALAGANAASAGSGKENLTPYIVFFAVGLVCMAVAIFPVLSAIVAFGARSSIANESTSKAPHIAAIVFGALSSTPFLIAGAVISLIQINIWSRRRQFVDEEVE